MKKLLVALLALFVLAGCSAKKKDPVIQEPEEPVASQAGGWTINDSLPEMDDAIFDNARQKLTGASYSPLLVLAKQVVNGTNYLYFCYERAVIPNATPGFKIVTVNKAPGNSFDSSIINVADFEITDFTNGQGETTPDGLLGGWQETEWLPNFLSDEENAIFEKAFEGFTGVSYTPISKLASQVVAGTNYAFLAMGTTVTAEPKTHFYVVNIYNDLEGKATINNICGLDLTKFTAK